MSVWTRLAALAAHAFDPEVEPPVAPAREGSAATACAPDVDDVGFTVAVIGLAAKMAKADGHVADIEVSRAAHVFRPPQGEEENFRRVFSLARQTVHGFESYARQIGRKYRDRPCLLEDVLDGLFQIALSDGYVTRDELAYLARVSELFGFSPMEFRRIKAANLGPDPGDPYAALGLLPGATLEECRSAWRKLVGENHPDRLAARGAPPEIVALAQAKTASLNEAWAAIRVELDTPEPVS